MNLMRILKTSVLALAFFLVPFFAYAEVSFIGASSGSNSAQYPAGTQPGDLILGFASRDQSMTGTVPNGWTLLSEASHVLASGNNIWTRFAFRYAGTETSTGSFPSSENLILLVYRGMRTDYSLTRVPNFTTAVNNGGSNSVVYPAIALASPGLSHRVWFIAQDGYNSAGVDNTLSGMINRSVREASSNAVAGHDSNGNAVDGTAFTVNVGSALAARTYTLEIEPASTTEKHINILNIASTTESFHAYAYHNTGATSTIAIRTDYPNGFGVTGNLNGATGDTTEIGASGSGLSERLVVQFDQPVASSSVYISWLDSGQIAYVGLYSAAGVFLGTSTIAVSNDTINGAFPIDIGQPYARMEFTAGPSDNYLINSIYYHTSTAVTPVTTGYINTTEPTLVLGGHIGQTITVSGSNFGGVCSATNFITIGTYQIPCASVTAWSDTSITFTIPAGTNVTSGYLFVNTSSGTSAGLPFTVYPHITSVAAFSTNADREGSSIELIGTMFGVNEGTVTFSGAWGTATSTIQTSAVDSCTIGGWASTSVCITVPTSIPDNAYSATITLIRSDGATTTLPNFTISPRVTSMFPSSVAAGDTLTITGDHLCQLGICPTVFDGTNIIMIGGATTTLLSWSHTGIIVTVPSGLSAGTHNVTVTTGGIIVSAGTVTFVLPPTVTLTAATTTVAVGSSTILTWSGANAVSCTASDGWSGTRATSGSELTGAINSVTTFTLACTNIAGTATSSVTVTTVSAALVSLVASPTSVPLSGTSTLSWTSSGATSCVASGGWSGAKLLSGTEGAGPLATTTLFMLQCSNLAGTTTATTSVTVMQPPVLSGVQGGYINTTNSALTDGGSIGDSIIITGANFGESCSTINFVTIDEYIIPCASVTNWTSTSITFMIPGTINTIGGTGTNGLVITVGEQASSPATFVVYPKINSVAAEGTNAGKEGSYIQLIGTSFGTSAGTVTFSGSWGTTTATVSSIAQGSCTVGGFINTSVCVQIPSSIPDNAYSATITLTRTDGREDSAPTFTLLPHITTTAPGSGMIGDTVTISGDHLCQSGTCPVVSDGANMVTIGGVAAVLVSWSHTGIVVTIPSGVSAGGNVIVVTTGGFSIVAGSVMVLSTEPNTPNLGPSMTMGQFSAGVAVGIGSATASSSITFSAEMSAQTSALLTLEVEVKPIGSAFDGSNIHTSDSMSYSGVVVLGSLTQTLSTNTSYHWRARVRNTTTNEVSAWVAFGSNPIGDGSGDGVPSNVDFTIVVDGPILGGVGTAPNCSAHDLVQDTSARISWTASSVLTPIQNKVRVSTSSNMVNSLEYTASNGISPQVTLTGLSAETAYFYQVLSQDSLGTETIAQENDPHCTFITEEASKRINKLSEFYICQMHEQNEVWTGGSGETCISGNPGAKTFNVFVSEMIASKPVVQTSAFVEVFGIAEASSDFTVTVNVNNLGPKTTTIKNPQGSIPYRVLYHLPNGYNLDFPADISASNLLDVQVEGVDAVSSMGAKAILNYYYFPTY